eukprot:scpid80076/ scgid23799/ Band 7 protein AAEL010189
MIPDGRGRYHNADGGAGGAQDTGVYSRLMSVSIMFMSYFMVLCTFPVSLLFILKVVNEYERAVIFRLGRLVFDEPRGPGMFWFLPCVDEFRTVDLRTQAFDVPPQEMLTKDSVTIRVDAVVYYRVNGPNISITNVKNPHHSTKLLAQSSLRNVLGGKTLAEVLSDRDSISKAMQEALDIATNPWGILVERVEMKDVRLPPQLVRAMAAEAEADRDARAKVVSAEGEQNAARAYAEAADTMSEEPGALQLRYLQTLHSISAEKSSTIYFPLPLDHLGPTSRQ